VVPEDDLRLSRGWSCSNVGNGLGTVRKAARTHSSQNGSELTATEVTSAVGCGVWLPGRSPTPWEVLDGATGSTGSPVIGLSSSECVTASSLSPFGLSVGVAEISSPRFSASFTFVLPSGAFFTIPKKIPAAITAPTTTAIAMAINAQPHGSTAVLAPSPLTDGAPLLRPTPPPSAVVVAVVGAGLGIVETRSGTLVVGGGSGKGAPESVAAIVDGTTVTGSPVEESGCWVLGGSGGGGKAVVVKGDSLDEGALVVGGAPVAGATVGTVGGTSLVGATVVVEGAAVDDVGTVVVVVAVVVGADVVVVVVVGVAVVVVVVVRAAHSYPTEGWERQKYESVMQSL
jgi:hypothetical protein